MAPNTKDPLVEAAKQLATAEADLAAAQAKFDTARKQLAELVQTSNGHKRRSRRQRSAHGRFASANGQSVAERVVEYLRNSPNQQPRTIVKELGAKEATIRHALWQLKKEGAIQRSADGGYNAIS